MLYTRLSETNINDEFITTDLQKNPLKCINTISRTEQISGKYEVPRIIICIEKNNNKKCILLLPIRYLKTNL